MVDQRYIIIKTDKQYFAYCDKLEQLAIEYAESNKDDIELLTLLIEKYDEEQISYKDKNPVELIKLFMAEHKLKAKDLADILDVNKSTVSRILNFKKGLSKKSIRILAEYFAISQESLNRTYELKNKVNRKFKHASLMNTRKNIKSKHQSV